MDSTVAGGKTFTLNIKDAVAHLRFCRPDKANSMNKDFWSEFPKSIQELSQNNDVRVLLISGEGKNFSSGMDLSVFADSQLLSNADARSRESLRCLVLELQACFSLLEQLRIPVIAAINGACIGGALDLVAACDIRFATKSAYFCIHETNLAMMADLGSLQRLPYLLPEGIVRELAYTGDKLGADDATRHGFLNKVFDSDQEMMDHALLQAQKIASKSPLAICASKQCLNYNRSHSIADSLEYCANVQAGILDLQDLAAAAQAQASKSAAAFSDLKKSASLR
jgi:enoyl-CoA hydratase